MGNSPFPLSRVHTKHRAFQPGDDPLAILYPHEVTAAELYVLEGGPIKGASSQKRPAFATRFREHFGFELSSNLWSGLRKNPAWTAYVRQMQEQTRAVVMRKLEQQALPALKDYLWSREQAREAGDYKETRIAAADHLDRIGATEKPTDGPTQVVVLLKGRNFEVGALERTLAPVEHEIVVSE